MEEKRYPGIGDYGFIGDCHSAALISRSGSIDWCCMPRIDSSSCFGRILGWEKGGYCRVVPVAPFDSSRNYVDRTLVLETRLLTEDGEIGIFDFFPMRKGGEHRPHCQILRIAEGRKGKVKLAVDIEPRFDYGAIKPWIKKRGENLFLAIGGCDGLLISGDFPMEMRDRHSLSGTAVLEEGRRIHLSILHRPPEDLEEDIGALPSADELDRRLEETIQWWRRWSSQSKVSGFCREQLLRSSIVLKALTNAPTGAIAAAPTTSLPESPGGSKNWDYRFTWIRDSCFTVRSLGEIGFDKEADGFRRFVERSAAGSAEELQVLFGVGGERRLHEHVIKELEGYRGAKPVRVGNAAREQTQLDVYGNLMDLAWRWHNRGHAPDDDYWAFLAEIVNTAAKLWEVPDQGIWEVRGSPRHFVYSKATCWTALDRGIRLAEDLGRDAPLDRWKEVRQKIRALVERKGYDNDRGVFIQAFDYPVMDASLLLLPAVGFVAYDDERMSRTTDAIEETLSENGLLRRYAPGDDGMEDREGVFLACSFWLAECLARQGRYDKAHDVFERALAAGNDLGLYSEEYDPESGEMLGNFPQGLTHFSLIAAAVALGENKPTV